MLIAFKLPKCHKKGQLDIFGPIGSVADRLSFLKVLKHSDR